MLCAYLQVALVHLLQLCLALALHPGELLAQLVVVKLRIQLLLLTEELDACERRLHDGMGCLAAQAQLQRQKCRRTADYHSTTIR